MSTGIGARWLIKDRELRVDMPLLIGILNVTPDSFSDGGQYVDPGQAVAHAESMLAEGAVIIDVGGESTRPGSEPVSTDEEKSRVLSVIQTLANETHALISIDTQKSAVAEAAISAGAHIINDISAGLADQEMFKVVRDSGAGYIMMHMQGTPATMQRAPSYDNVIDEVETFLGQRLQAALDDGIVSDRIVLDPGIGFGKTLENNLLLMGQMKRLQDLGRPLLLGASRKSFIGMLDDSVVAQRLGGSLAAVLATYQQGIRIFRVHDVWETRQLIDIFTAIQKHSD